MSHQPLSAEQVRAYERDGYIIVPKLFDAEEIDLLGRTAREDRTMDHASMGRADGEGGTVRLSIWNQPGDGIYGMVARSRRIVDRVEQLLGDEAYHYHSKMIMKDAKVGGAWAWHQDYGYWYHDGVLKPDLLSVFIAVDRSTRENGCLQVLRGSHHIGRVDHVLTGDQAGADPERIAAARERYELVYVEMEPGDGLFFHSNLFHRSDQNRSDHPRWTMVCCYNARSNDPYKPGKHSSYTPLEKVDDDAVLTVGRERFEQGADSTVFLNDSEESRHWKLDTEVQRPSS